MKNHLLELIVIKYSNLYVFHHAYIKTKLLLFFVLIEE